MSQNPAAKKSNNGSDFTPTIHNDTYPAINPTQFNLSNRAVFVTGASKGIGLAVSEAFAKAGASYIALGARSSLEDSEKAVLAAAKEAGRQPPKVLKLKVDVSDPKSVEAAAKDIEGQFGRLDILINNAGYLEPFVPLAESDPNEWSKTWDINIKGVYLVTRALMPLMLKTSGGLKTILNASSVGAHGLRPGASAYQTSKLAVSRLSEFIGTEYGEQGVLSYSVHPGGVATELALGMPEYMHAVLNDTPRLSGDSICWFTAERREWLQGRWVSVNWDAEELVGMKGRIVEGDLLKVRLDVGLE